MIFIFLILVVISKIKFQFMKVKKKSIFTKMYKKISRVLLKVIVLRT